jgi:FXSXX-COOH protein
MNVTASAELDSDLVDVSGLSIDEVDKLPGTVLAAMLRRITDDALCPVSESVTAFNSSF